MIIPKWGKWTADNGHRSIDGDRSDDGVRTYKRESTEQKRSLSNVLNAASSGQSVPYEVEVKRPKIDNGEENSGGACAVRNISTQHTIATKLTATAPTFNFASCSSITTNYLKD